MAHLLPVGGDAPQLGRVNAGIARAVAQRLGDRAEIGLGGEAGHRIDRAIDRIRACLDGGEHACGADATGVVRVKVQWQADFLFQGPHQDAGRMRLAQPAHVLDAQDMGAHGLELGRKLQVITQVVLGFLRIREVAGIAEGRLAQSSAAPDRLDSDLHVLGPVQAVEDPEDIDTGLSGLLDKVAHDIVRIVGVAHRVGRAE